MHRRVPFTVLEIDVSLVPQKKFHNSQMSVACSHTEQSVVLGSILVIDRHFRILYCLLQLSVPPILGIPEGVSK